MFVRPACICLLLLLAPAVIAQDRAARPAVESGGLLQYDGYWYNDTALDSRAGDGRHHDRDLRRAEFSFKGKFGAGWDWVVHGDVDARRWGDVNLRRRFGTDGRHQLTIGQFKQPSVMDELVSTSGLDFIAKSAATGAFATSRRLGLGYTLQHGDWTLQASAFGRELTDGQARGNGIAGRVVWSHDYGDAGRLHVAGSLLHRGIDGDALRLRVRPQADLAAQRRLDTGNLADSRRLTTSGAELAWLRGPFKVQAEWLRTRVARGSGHADFTADGGYVSALWTLTGEPWQYRGATVVAPTAARGHGTWQLGLRHDRLDLNGAGVDGGRMHAWTVGVNWLYGKHLKVAANHVRADSRRAARDYSDRIDEVRLQWSW